MLYGAAGCCLCSAAGHLEAQEIQLEGMRLRKGCLSELGALAPSVKTLRLIACRLSEFSLWMAVRCMPLLSVIDIKGVRSVLRMQNDGFQKTCRGASRLRPLCMFLSMSEHEYSLYDTDYVTHRSILDSAYSIINTWNAYAATRNLPHKTQLLLTYEQPSDSELDEDAFDTDEWLEEWFENHGHEL